MALMAMQGSTRGMFRICLHCCLIQFGGVQEQPTGTSVSLHISGTAPHISLCVGRLDMHLALQFPFYSMHRWRSRDRCV